MSEVDYHGIAEDLAIALRNDPQQRLAGATVVVENNDPMADAVPYVAVFLSSRTTEERRIGGTTPYELTVRLEVWTYEYSAKDFADACRRRDLTLRKVEQVIRDNRKFSSVVQTSTVVGGDFETALGGGGFWSGGSVIVEALVRA